MSRQSIKNNVRQLLTERFSTAGENAEQASKLELVKNAKIDIHSLPRYCRITANSNRIIVLTDEKGDQSSFLNDNPEEKKLTRQKLRSAPDKQLAAVFHLNSTNGGEPMIRIFTL